MEAPTTPTHALSHVCIILWRRNFLKHLLITSAFTARKCLCVRVVYVRHRKLYRRENVARVRKEEKSDVEFDEGIKSVLGYGN